MSKLLAQCCLIVVMFAVGLVLALTVDKAVGLGLIGTAVGYAGALFQSSPLAPNPAIPPGA